MIQQEEFIGYHVSIEGAQNASLVGLKGLVVDETKNTFVLETKNGLKCVLKQGVILSLIKEDRDYLIEGSLLVKRPHERIKK